jgi:hypothetical protein
VPYFFKEIKDLDSIIEKNLALKYSSVATENIEKRLAMKKQGEKYAAIARTYLASKDYFMV